MPNHATACWETYKPGAVFQPPQEDFQVREKAKALRASVSILLLR